MIREDLSEILHLGILFDANVATSNFDTVYSTLLIRIENAQIYIR